VTHIPGTAELAVSAYFEILLIACFLIFHLPQVSRSRSRDRFWRDAISENRRLRHGQRPRREDVRSNDLDLGTILMMDRSFDPTRFLKTAQELFFKIQGAWNRRDTAALGSLCGSELMQTWHQELAKLGARGQTNRMENIALSSSEITEAWAEAGQDYITVRFQANLLDYTVDETSGAVVEGSNSEPVEFEEFWTFSRPVGPNLWKLSAVQQA
jgi:hypothetical protein